MTRHRVRRCRGGYMLLSDVPIGHRGPVTYEALCAEEDCGRAEEFEVSSCHRPAVPAVLRRLGWTMTGEKRTSLWWCPLHRQADGR